MCVFLFAFVTLFRNVLSFWPFASLFHSILRSFLQIKIAIRSQGDCVRRYEPKMEPSTNNKIVLHFSTNDTDTDMLLFHVGHESNQVSQRTTAAICNYCPFPVRNENNFLSLFCRVSSWLWNWCPDTFGFHGMLEVALPMWSMDCPLNPRQASAMKRTSGTKCTHKGTSTSQPLRFLSVLKLFVGRLWFSATSNKARIICQFWKSSWGTEKLKLQQHVIKMRLQISASLGSLTLGSSVCSRCHHLSCRILCWRKMRRSLVTPDSTWTALLTCMWEERQTATTYDIYISTFEKGRKGPLLLSEAQISENFVHCSCLTECQVRCSKAASEKCILTIDMWGCTTSET